MIYNANNSFFYFKEDNTNNMISDYYYFIVDIIIKIIQNLNKPINICLSCDNYVFNNRNKTIKIDINYEHTLVKTQGRDIPFGTPYGNITYENDKKYLARIR